MVQRTCEACQNNTERNIVAYVDSEDVRLLQNNLRRKFESAPIEERDRPVDDYGSVGVQVCSKCAKTLKQKDKILVSEQSRDI